jgi:hypothetical protein
LLHPDHALEGGVVIEQAWGSAHVTCALATCGVHELLIGAKPPEGDPWRE